MKKTAGQNAKTWLIANVDASLGIVKSNENPR